MNASKTRGRARAASTSSTSVDRWNAPKAEAVWKALGQQFGVRFYDQFGSVPSVEWAMAIEEMATKQLDGALAALARNPPPYAGWLPTLPDFIATCNRVRISDPAGERRTTVNVGSWVIRVCRGLALRWTFNLPFNIDKEQLAEQNKALHEVVALYEIKLLQLWPEHPPQGHPVIAEVEDALRAELEELKRQWIEKATMITAASQFLKD